MISRFSRLALIARFYLKKQFAKKTSYFGVLSLPIIILAIWLFKIDQLLGLPVKMNYSIYILPGLLGIYLMGRSVRLGFVFSPELNRSLRLWLTLPIKPSELIGGFIIGELVFQLITIVIFLFMLSLFSLTTSFVALLGILAYSVMIALCFLGLSVCIIMLFDSRDLVQIIYSAMLSGMSFISPAFYRIEESPWLLKSLISLNPLSYGIDGLRLFITGAHEMNLLVGVLYLLIFITCAMGAGIYLLKRKTFFYT